MKKIILALFLLVFVFGFKYSMAFAEDVDMSEVEQAEIAADLAKAKAEEKALKVEKVENPTDRNEKAKADRPKKAATPTKHKAKK